MDQNSDEKPEIVGDWPHVGAMKNMHASILPGKIVEVDKKTFEEIVRPPQGKGRLLSIYALEGAEKKLGDPEEFDRALEPLRQHLKPIEEQ